ncbi:MAG: hypothetical protein PHQ43_13585 [Dehalococcoidales bacterium]|jgi:hypothetical protein|nr:hypothetical protein [Dehalococcoidales bacterium]
MSIGCYRVIKREYADQSWNLWHDDKLREFLAENTENGFYDRLNEHGGTLVIEVSVLKKAIKQATDLQLKPETVAALKADVAAAKKAGEDTVTYDCF